MTPRAVSTPVSTSDDSAASCSTTTSLRPVITVGDASRTWGERRQTVPSELLAPLDLPSADKEFLRQVGLPLRVELGFEFFLLHEDPAAALSPVEVKAGGSSISGYTIGWGEYGLIIAAKGFGTVLYAEGKTPEVVGFFNSSVAAFGEFLLRYEHQVQRIERGEIDQEAAAEELRAALKASDPPAMRCDLEPFWTTEIEGMACGL